jgi:hypothetical protein
LKTAIGQACIFEQNVATHFSAMKIACVMMQRNEDVCLEPWLRYQGHLFGYENLFLLDHNSTNLNVLATLKAFIHRGIHVITLPPNSDYRRKGEFVSFAMRQVGSDYDFVLPLDCDEFVAMRKLDGQPTCEREDLENYFSSLPAETKTFEVHENFLNMLGHPTTFFALPYKKVFFRGGFCREVDHGSHNALSLLTTIGNTRLAYIHFHHKSFERYRQAAKEKLRPFVDVENPVALANFRGTGWHLVTHLQKTREQYYAIMKPDQRCFEFYDLYRKFLALGLDPRFCEL